MLAPVGVTTGSSYGGSYAFSLNSPQPSEDFPPLDESTRGQLNQDLMKASMECMGYMCTEISIKHKAAKFRDMLSAADSILEGVEVVEGGTPSSDVSGGSRQRVMSNPSTMKSRARTASLLENEIPAVLARMRENIEDCEELIQSLRYKLDIKEEEGAWGRVSNSFSLIYGSSRGHLDSWHHSTSSGGSAGRRSSAPPDMQIRGRRTESYGVWSESEARPEEEASMIDYVSEDDVDGEVFKDALGAGELGEDDVAPYRADSSEERTPLDTSASQLRGKMDVLGDNMIDLEQRIRAASNPVSTR
jgi:hypothetical protein